MNVSALTVFKEMVKAFLNKTELLQILKTLFYFGTLMAS
jgi:hypothetical protein